MSSARAMCHMSHASELRSSRGRTRICSSVRPAKVRSATDILLPPTAAECTAACWSRNRSRASMGVLLGCPAPRASCEWGCAHSISLRRRASKPAPRPARRARGANAAGVAYCRVVIQFLVIWSGQLVSQTGTAMTAFALLVWAYQETGRATSVALLGAAWFVPFVLVSPFAGVWVDRLDRRRVMLWADVAAGAITLGLLALHWSGRLQVWHLY